MKKLLILALTVLTVGCATSQGPTKMWYKDGATQESFGRDKVYCRQYGMQSATANGMTNNMFVEIWILNAQTECMRDLGWVQR